MKNVFYIILGICLVILTSATTVTVMTIKPATPKITVAVSAWNASGLNSEMRPYLQRGFVVKNIAVGDGFKVVIMEKY